MLRVTFDIKQLPNIESVVFTRQKERIEVPYIELGEACVCVCVVPPPLADAFSYGHNSGRLWQATRRHTIHNSTRQQQQQ